MEPTPTLRRSGDDTRSYQLLSTPDELRELFRIFGFRHYPGRPENLWTDRWTHGDKIDRTVLLLFPSGRLSLLGPRLPQVDELAEEVVTR